MSSLFWKIEELLQLSMIHIFPMLPKAFVVNML